MSFAWRASGCSEESPASRNQTRDHLITASVYSQMLYQLSYSRFHTEIAVNGCGISMRATCVGVTRAVASADAPSNTDRPSQKKTQTRPARSQRERSICPTVTMHSHVLGGGVSKAQRSTPRFCTTSRKRQTTIPGGSGSSTVLNTKPSRSCRHGHMV